MFLREFMEDYNWNQNHKSIDTINSTIVVVRTKFDITNKYLIVIAAPDAFLLIVWCIVA